MWIAASYVYVGTTMLTGPSKNASPKREDTIESSQLFDDEKCEVPLNDSCVYVGTTMLTGPSKNASPKREATIETSQLFDDEQFEAWLNDLCVGFGQKMTVVASDVADGVKMETSANDGV